MRIWPMRATLAAVTLLVAAVLAGCGSPPGPQRIEITIHYSHFDPAQLSVPIGVPITFVLVNQDPIEHEWLLGDDAFHDRHRTGTEPHHAGRPTEVSIPALSTVETTITFDAPAEWQYICHLPRHEAYGMLGTLRIN